MPKKAMIDYGISISLDSSGLVKGEKNAKRVADRITRNINKMRKAEDEFRHAQAQLANALKKGTITRKEYNRELAREQLNIEKARSAQARYEMGIRKQTDAINKNTLARQKNRRFASARGSTFGGDMGNAGGNIASAMGLGGSVAGGARMAGLATGGGLMGSMAVVGLGALVTQKSFQAYAKFEDQLIRLQVLFGKGLGTKLSEEFRDLALNTALSRDSIAEAAIIWRSYGLETEGITERVRRIGEVSGGSAERMKLLATALAQVNSVGRLMGQERLQLLNAGFNLSEIAKVAGVEMSNFQKAMEEGRITAEHVNQALVNMTSEGGTHFGFLNEKAKTLNGRMEKLGESVNELFIAFGQAESGFFADSITWAEGFTEFMRQSAMYWGLIANNHPNGEISRVGANGEGYLGPGADYFGENQRGSITGVGYDTSAVYGSAQGRPKPVGMHARAAGDSVFYYGRDIWRDRTNPSRGGQHYRAATLDRQLGMNAWDDKEAEAEAKRGTVEYKMYWEAKGREEHRQKKERERRRATSRGFTFGDIGSAASYAWNYSVDAMEADDPLNVAMGAGAQIGQWGSGAAQWAQGAWQNNSIGWGDAQALGRMDETARMQESLLEMMGLGRDNTPPEIKKIMEDRAEAIAKLDEDAKRSQISKGLGSGAVGAGSEYEYLAKSRKAQRDYEEQKKRDKERNEKLEEIDEKARQQLEDQLLTNEALREFVANSGSV